MISIKGMNFKIPRLQFHKHRQHQHSCTPLKVLPYVQCALDTSLFYPCLVKHLLLCSSLASVITTTALGHFFHHSELNHPSVQTIRKSKPFLHFLFYPHTKTLLVIRRYRSEYFISGRLFPKLIVKKSASR